MQKCIDLEGEYFEGDCLINYQNTLYGNFYNISLVSFLSHLVYNSTLLEVLVTWIKQKNQKLHTSLNKNCHKISTILIVLFIYPIWRIILDMLNMKKPSRDYPDEVFKKARYWCLVKIFYFIFSYT